MVKLKKMLTLVLASSIALATAGLAAGCSVNPQNEVNMLPEGEKATCTCYAIFKGNIDDELYTLHIAHANDKMTYFMTDCGYQNIYDAVGKDYTYYGNNVYSDIERLVNEEKGIKLSEAKYQLIAEDKIDQIDTSRYQICEDCFHTDIVK